MNMPQYQWQTTARPTAAELDVGLRQHMLRVYNYMGLGLVLTGLVAYLVSSVPAIYGPIFGSNLKYVVMLAPLAFVFFLSFRIHAVSSSTAQLVFWAFCGAMGLSMASIFLAFTGTSIARTFMITAVMFGAMSLYGYTTKADLSRFGSFLMMGLVGIIIASIVNIFLGSTALQFIVSVAGVLIFTGLTAWDTQRIKEEYAEHYGSESLNKMALMGALSLYLNFINMFQLLLNLTGSREE
ncbi:Bax inhibitor-1/YccA family protein [Inquilinus sp. YAF38]|uniref:Bax inhibitor-1/YccA family protein n=1 Tax=Inquilinus sp. YAF38 TaxID=3233084 RepID=UPI003F93BA3B